MRQRIDFTVHLNTPFGFGLDNRKCHIGETPEETFLNAWKSLPKRQDKNWISIVWQQNNKEFEVSRGLLRECRFDFNAVVETTDL